MSPCVSLEFIISLMHQHRHIPSFSLIIENGNETRPREHIEWIALPRDLEEKTPSSHLPLTFGCLVSSMFGLDLAESIRRFTFANAKRAYYQKTKPRGRSTVGEMGQVPPRKPRSLVETLKLKLHLFLSLTVPVSPFEWMWLCLAVCSLAVKPSLSRMTLDRCQHLQMSSTP